MIIVIGSAIVRTERLDEAIAVSLTHVHRSRTEPGCISHAVHQDVEQPNKLTFVEEWEDPDALRTHFGVPASSDFVVALATMTTENPTMHIFEANRTRV